MAGLTEAAAVRTVRGACALDCPDACSWVVEVDADGRAQTISGNRDHPFTAGALCGKTNRYLELVYGPDRLLTPLRRVGAKGEGRFEPIGWDEAIETVAEGLKAAIARHGGESILPVCHGGTMGALQGGALPLRVLYNLGSSQLMANMCDPAAQVANAYTLGASVGYDPEDIVHARLIVLWGINTMSTNIHHWKFVKEAQQRGARVVTIDPLRSATAEKSDEWIAPLPGTDGALALGLMRVILDEGAADEQWLTAHTVGWPELRQRLDQWPVTRAAETCGLPPQTIVELGRRIAHTRPTAIRLGLGMQRHGGAGAAVRAVLAISAVTGDWRHPGGGALHQTEGNMPHDPGRVLADDDAPQPATREINIAQLGAALTELDDPPVAATVIWNVNPAASNPDVVRVREGLARDDLFCVVLEHKLTDTCDFADVVLPATTEIEHMDIIGSYGHNYLAWNEPAIAPLGEALPNTEIFRSIARAMDVQDLRCYESDLQLAARILDTEACRARGITLERLRDEGFVRAADYPLGTAPYAEGNFPTPSGKLELLCERMEEDVDPLVGYVPPHEVADEQLAERYPLVLLTPAARFFINSTYASMPWHRKKVGPPLVHLHPQDAGARGIADGDAVVVRNDRGAFQARAAITDGTRPGVAFSLKSHWLKLVDGGANVNATTPQRLADMGGAATFHDNRVEVEPVVVTAGAGDVTDTGARA